VWSGPFFLYSCKRLSETKERSPRLPLPDVERLVAPRSVFAIGSTLTYLRFFWECAIIARDQFYQTFPCGYKAIVSPHGPIISGKRTCPQSGYKAFFGRICRSEVSTKHSTVLFSDVGLQEHWFTNTQLRLERKFKDHRSRVATALKFF